MADWPIETLGARTILQKAHTPHMDGLARRGIIGSVRTVPQGLAPGSDVANLSILGYDPRQYYTGRAPLEAVSMGIELRDDDVAYRCNLVSLREDKGVTVMDDYSGGHITTAEARELVDAVNDMLGTDVITFYPGVSFRNLMVWKGGSTGAVCVPPHDILDQPVAGHLPTGEGAEVLRDLMRRSAGVLGGHPVNDSRREAGRKAANSIWLWGQGRRPRLPSYNEKYRIRGALISAVDLTKGLGVCAGFTILNVPGATGWIDTNYRGKAEYALKALEETDFVYVHVEAPDEAGHSGDYALKLRAVEDLDAQVVGPIMEGLRERFRSYRVLLMPDHATPVAMRTHTPEPVPFVVYDSEKERDNGETGYDETITSRGDAVVIEEGYRLMDYFIREVLPQ